MVFNDDIMRSLLFRVNGSKKIGMGHVIRDIEVAKCLTEYYYPIYFLTKNNPPTIDYINKNGFKAMIFPNDNDKESNIKIQKILEKSQLDDIILDIYNIRQSEINFYKKFCNRVICFTDETYKLNIVADIIFAFSPNQKGKYYSSINEGKFYIGPKYFPLNPIFSNKNSKEQEKNIKKILVTMGGSDVNNLTTRVLNNLLKINYNFEITAILGHGFGETDQNMLNRYIKKGIKFKRNVKNMHEEMMKTNIAICSAGNTLLELMCTGIPTLVLPQTTRENAHANAYKKKGAILKVPNYGNKIKDKDIFLSIKKLIEDLDLRSKISKNALKVIDGKGVFRIVNILKTKNE